MTLPFSRKDQTDLASLADRARDAGEWDAAAALYRTALARDFRNPPLWVQYGHALKESGALRDPVKLARAEAAYRRALAYAPRVADTHLQLGHVLKLQGRADDAKSAYLRALALDPASAAARGELRALGWDEDGGAELHNALASLAAVAPPRRRRPSLIEQADAARDAALWTQAARCYRALLDRDPGNAAIWVQYGHALKEDGNLKDPARLAEAETAYRRALALTPRTADTHLQLGHVLKLQSKTEEAEAAYLRAFALDPATSQTGKELRHHGWPSAMLRELQAVADPRVVATENPSAPPYRSLDNNAPVSVQAIPNFDNSFRLVYISGEPHTPGHIYRVVRPMAAAARAGAHAICMDISQIPTGLDAIKAANALIIWRALSGPEIDLAIDTARQNNVKIIFDVDDLMIDPSVATVEIIDGIRSDCHDEQQIKESFSRFRSVMWSSDLCLAPTNELAAHMHNAFKPALTFPNTFDHNTFNSSSIARRGWLLSRDDECVRIGYAAGTRTHQKDFLECVEGLARALRDRPMTRLVLFNSEKDVPRVDLSEFPSLHGLENQIEWRSGVSLVDLPLELARFDINIAPLEIENPFCESKSELKFFESALVGVPTIASATGPFRRSIWHGKTGYLASAKQDWYDLLIKLVDDAELRSSIGRNARREVLWHYGPERATRSMETLIDLLKGGRIGARAFEHHALKQGRRSEPTAVPLPEFNVIFVSDKLRRSSVTVVIPLFNYEQRVCEALDSVAKQTEPDVDLVIADDSSTDASLSVALDWVKAHTDRFNRICVLQNRINAGLGCTRNLLFDWAETPYVLALDADNRLLPDCVSACVRVIQENGTAFAYPVIQKFEGAEGLLGNRDYDPLFLSNGNYIDAMALISKAAWVAVGGYDDTRTGWEDFDLWCKFAEQGFRGIKVPGNALAEYRVHSESMISVGNRNTAKVQWMMDHLRSRHPWLTLVWPLPEAVNSTASIPGNDRLRTILPLLRCPETGGRLTLRQGELTSVDGSRRWPVIEGRPVLFPGMIAAPIIKSTEHVSNPLPEKARELIRAVRGPILNLSAGASDERFDHVIEVETAVFKHTDVVADVHRLPFAEKMFEAVLVFNAFEHYRDPHKAAGEIYRVLKPGGCVFIHTAFLQPLHEEPWHFFNCTRYGLETWFEKFETQSLQVSDNFHAGYSMSWLASECESLVREHLGTKAADHLSAASFEQIMSLWRTPKTRDRDPLWSYFRALPETAQERVAAGFEYLGRRPS